MSLSRRDPFPDSVCEQSLSRQPVCWGCLRLPVLYGVLLVGRPHAAPKGRRRKCDAIFFFWSRLVLGGPVRSSAAWRASSFAFVKFIMCLLVPEVKAVSCAPLLHMQVLETTKKMAFLRRAGEALRQALVGPASRVGIGRFLRRLRLLKHQLYDPIVHDMPKLWRTRTVNMLRRFFL